MREDTVMETLMLTLQLAVPLRMAELRDMTQGQRLGAIRDWAADAAEVIASNGDTLMFRTKPFKLKDTQLTANSRRKPGDVVSTATTFNRLVRGLAALAYCPGGIRFGGVHWCVEHPWGVSTDGVAGRGLTCFGWPVRDVVDLNEGGGE